MNLDNLGLQLPSRHLDGPLVGLVNRCPSRDLDKNCELLNFIRNFIHSHLLLLSDFKVLDVMWDQGVSDDVLSSRLRHLVQEEGWTQHVRKPTRYCAGQKPSLLDLRFPREPHLVDRIQSSAPLGKSDHVILKFDYPCFWTCKLALKISPKLTSHAFPLILPKQSPVMVAQTNSSYAFNLRFMNRSEIHPS